MDFFVFQVNGKYVIKSGVDFRNFSKICLNFDKTNAIDVTIEEISVTSSYAEDPVLKEKLEQYSGSFNADSL